VSEKTVQDKGIANLHLSLSHDGQMAIAYVIAEGA
jgi:phosphopantetheinyl transferase (holo-ACP synthase)